MFDLSVRSRLETCDVCSGKRRVQGVFGLLKIEKYSFPRQLESQIPR